MAALTVSHCKGGGSLRHNDREFYAENVDPEMVHNNIVLIKEDLDEAYERCFGEAVREYNDKQTRKDRKIENYREKVKNSGNGEKEFYETVVQFGNRDTAGFDPVTHEPTDMAMLCRDMLIEYVGDFQKRNPNIHVFRAVIHMDEPKGTPHLHMDWIPVATGYKKGLQVRNSLDKALRQQGLEPSQNRQQGKHNNATTAWHEQEKARMGWILERHGLEREDLNVGGQHRSVQEFKELNRIHEADMAKAKAEVDLGKAITPVIGEKYYKVPLVQAESLKEAVANVAVWNEYSKGVEASQRAEKAHMRRRERNIDSYLEKVEKKAEEAENDLFEARDKLELAWETQQQAETLAQKPWQLLEEYPKVEDRYTYEYRRILPEEVEDLMQENADLKKENRDLRKEVSALESRLKNLLSWLQGKFKIKHPEKVAKAWNDERTAQIQEAREDIEATMRGSKINAQNNTRGGWER